MISSTDLSSEDVKSPTTVECIRNIVKEIKEKKIEILKGFISTFNTSKRNKKDRSNN